MSPRWTNWSGTVRTQMVRQEHPRDVEAVAAAVRAAGRDGLRVKPVGAGHSFTGAAATDGVQLVLDGLTGIVHADLDSGLVTVRAGTRLHQLGRALDALGLAMTNLGDIDAQTIAGAISTGTHGTGGALGSLSSQVRAVELVTADGAVLTASTESAPEVFEAARLGLGALGVLTSVTLACEPAFLLRAEEAPMPLDAVLDELDGLVQGNDHVEFFWWPHTRSTTVKRLNRLPADAAPAPRHPWRAWFDDRFMANTVFGAATALGRRCPAAVPLVNRAATTLAGSRSYADASYRVLATPRLVRFAESEWALPREALPEVLGQLEAVTRRLEHPVAFPVEVRFGPAENVWLSPAHGRATVYVAVHQALGMPRERWFADVAALALAAGGRPHWGKLHPLDAARLCALYPRFDDFVAVRDRLDPRGMFANAYLDRVLGPASGS
ncbi:MAG TPA: D-arabinono-1,4-lactone oxidase [Actinomycetes bacterium]|nr:D-arabinono-1,4-lactone oxidase [Actinomycetes bacterium]